MLQQFDTVEEARQRLAGSVVLYEDKPVYIYDISGSKPYSARVGFLPLDRMEKKEPVRLQLDDPSFTQVFPKLGYINSPKSQRFRIGFLSRIPNRGKYRQGLYDSNLAVRQNITRRRQLGDGNVSIGTSALSWICEEPGFIDMLAGKYESLKVCQNKLIAEPYKVDMNTGNASGYKGLAFDRQLSLSVDDFRGDFLLQYRGEPIGFGEDKFKILPEFKHLREMLDERGVPIK